MPQAARNHDLRYYRRLKKSLRALYWQLRKSRALYRRLKKSLLRAL